MAPASTSATYKKSTAARYSAAPVAAKPKGLAKRVQFGVRTGVSREEFAALVELWKTTGGKPDSATRNALADELGRYAAASLPCFSIADFRVNLGAKSKSLFGSAIAARTFTTMSGSMVLL